MKQGMLIFKQRRIGGPVGAHQDSTFLFTDPPSCVGLWTALQARHSISNSDREATALCFVSLEKLELLAL